MIRNLLYSITTGLAIFIAYLFAPIQYTQKELRPYVNEAMGLIKEHCDSTQYNHTARQIITFDNLGKYNIGLCIRGINGITIYIDHKFWNEADGDARYQTVLHEINHCMLYRDHVEDPNNFMYPDFEKLKKEDVRKQFISDIKEECRK